MTHFVKVAVSFLLSISLISCGGSGAENEVSKPLNSAPQVSLQDVTVKENSPISITASAIDKDGDLLSYSWRQTAGINITFESDNAILRISPFAVSKEEQFVFEVTVSDGISSNTASTTVTVENVKTQADIYENLQATYNTLRNVLDANNESTHKVGYETVGWYNKYNIDIHGDGDIDVLITSVAHLDHKNNREIYGNSYVIINEDNKYFSIHDLGHGKGGRTLEIFDANNDGLEDVYFANHGYESHTEGIFPGGQDYLWLQNSDGTFQDKTAELEQKLDFTHGSCIGDYTNSGVIDLISTYGNDVIYKKSNGVGGITEESERLPLIAISDKYANEYHTLGEDAPVSISHYWCESMDIDGDNDLDVVLGGRSSLYESVNGLGENINYHSTIIVNNGSGHFQTQDIQYVEFKNSALDDIKNGIEEAHPTGIFELNLDGDQCADFVTYHTNYGDDESFNVYLNTCEKPIQLAYTIANDTETYCEHIALSDNRIIAWCGSSKPKVIMFQKDKAIFETLSNDIILKLKPADYLKVAEYH